MEIEEIISKLNWFYSLELNQVDMYKAQSTTFEGTYHGQVFKRIADIEQRHVETIAEKIKIIGATPSLLGEVIAPITGILSGEIISVLGL